MKPPFSYYGGKVGMARRIVGLMPPHRVYIEPFFGSGAVLFAKPPAVHEIVNDADRAVVTFFRVLRERPDELELACSLSPHARDEFVAADLDEDVDDLELARRFWVRVNQSFAKTAGTQTGWSVTTAVNASVTATIRSRIRRFHAVVDRLQRVTIENCDAVGLVERLGMSEDTLIYCDPPYLASTRKSRQAASGAADYRHDMGTVEAHERLAEVLCATPATVILSGYPSPLYESLYAGWGSVDFQVTAHSSNALTTGRTGRVERIWSNRPLATTPPPVRRCGHVTAPTPPRLRSGVT